MNSILDRKISVGVGWRIGITVLRKVGLRYLGGEEGGIR